MSPHSTYLAQREAIDAAIRRVMESGVYVMGPEVAAFEREFADWLGAPGTVACANGTDALVLALQACGLGPGSVVATVSHTAVATVAAIELAGCTPLLLDVDAACTLDVDELSAVLQDAAGPRIAAVVVVHLYGQPAPMDAIAALCAKHGVILIEDCSQAHGAVVAGRMVGSFGDAASFSFYPTKNLGAFGDGGALVLRDPDAAETARRLRQYGWDRARNSQHPGRNSRLDELQAAILRVKLETLDAANAHRRAIAAAYDVGLAGAAVTPPVRTAGTTPVFHQYVIQSDRRDRLKQALSARSIETGIHYPLPVHRQAAYLHRVALGPRRCRTTDIVCGRILSLPIGSQMEVQKAAAIANMVEELSCELE